MGLALAKAQPVFNSGNYSGVSVELGQTALLVETASGVLPLSYQWMLIGSSSTALSNGTDANGSVMSGATTDFLTITGTAAADAGTYALAVTDANGYTVIGPAIALTVKPAAAPTITSQPSNVTVVEGTTTGFGVSASGSYPRTYQWYQGNPPSGIPVSGGTGQQLTLTPTSVANAGATTWLSPILRALPPVLPPL